MIDNFYNVIPPKHVPKKEKDFLTPNEVKKVLNDGGIKKIYAVYAETNIGRITFGTVVGKASLHEGMRKELYADEERYKDSIMKALEKGEVSDAQNKKDLSYMG